MHFQSLVKRGWEPGSVRGATCWGFWGSKAMEAARTRAAAVPATLSACRVLSRGADIAGGRRGGSG